MSKELTIPATWDQIEIPLNRSPLRILGIDLGTTNSAIAELVVGTGTGTLTGPRCLDVEQPTRQGPEFNTIVPSVLANYEGTMYVGAGAKDLRSRIGDLGLKQFRDIFWDCKNDMGVRRTYHRAPPGFRSARDISAYILRFLMREAGRDGADAPASVVVTVPASFQTAQRKDTIDAASLAGITLTDGALLDEPVAAFLHYMAERGRDVLVSGGASQRLVVFDFGGGTCDVAVFELRGASGDRSAPSIAPLSVSRYHRLGGGDIDRAIVAEILLPQVVEQNSLNHDDLDYRARSEVLIPALLGCAESLKISLCRETTRRRELGRAMNDPVGNPDVHRCALPDGRKVVLHAPSLTPGQFEKVLEPFLERDMLHSREGDFFMTCSVFAPLSDALERAGLRPSDIDLCLLAGGSAQIPQVADALERFLSNGRILRFSNYEDWQASVACGAAWQALSLSLRGRGILQPVVADSIGIRTQSGVIPLIPSDASLPYPEKEEWAETDQLVLPVSKSPSPEPLRVELVDGEDRILMSQAWDIPPTCTPGERLQLRYRMGQSQVLALELSRRGSNDDRPFRCTMENPLTNVVNPNAVRDQILDLEEQVRTKAIPTWNMVPTVKKIANLESELGRHERALSHLATVNRIRPSAGTLNQMGIIAGRMGNHERQEKFYREAARLSPGQNFPLFNLALAQKNRDRLDDALQTIDLALERESDPPGRLLKAQILRRMKRPADEYESIALSAMDAFDPLRSLSDFELSWYSSGARLLGDAECRQAAVKERRRRADTGIAAAEGVLPEARSELTPQTG